MSDQDPRLQGVRLRREWLDLLEGEFTQRYICLLYTSDAADE